MDLMVSIRLVTAPGLGTGEQSGPRWRKIVPLLHRPQIPVRPPELTVQMVQVDRKNWREVLLDAEIYQPRVGGRLRKAQRRSRHTIIVAGLAPATGPKPFSLLDNE